MSQGGCRRPVYVKIRAYFRLVRLGFVEDKVEVGQVFLRVLRRFILPVLSMQFILITVYSHTKFR